MPTVSVIIPAYNSESTILETIQSVQQQSFQDFELIVIDDGSRDGTADCVKSIQDPRIRLFVYENAGVSAARNRGIAEATGEFISFLDADDLWTADKLERQVAALQQSPEAGVAYSWTILMQVDGDSQIPTFYPLQRYSFSGDVYRPILLSNFIQSGSNLLIRQSAVASTGEFTVGLEASADWDYYIRLAARWPFVVVPDYQILYRRTLRRTLESNAAQRSAHNMTANLEQMESAALTAIERAYAVAPAELQSLKPQSLAGLHLYAAELRVSYAKTRQDFVSAQRHLWAAVQLQPATLLNSHTLGTILKSLLKLLLPEQWATGLLAKLYRPVTISDPRG